MNNLQSIDWVNRDHVDNTDQFISLYCQEFPRISSSCKTKKDLPYGSKNPVQTATGIDEMLMMDKYKKGRWYFNTTHFR